MCPRQFLGKTRDCFSILNRYCFIQSNMLFERTDQEKAVCRKRRFSEHKFERGNSWIWQECPVLLLVNSCFLKPCSITIFEISWCNDEEFFPAPTNVAEECHQQTTSSSKTWGGTNDFGFTGQIFIPEEMWWSPLVVMMMMMVKITRQKLRNVLKNKNNIQWSSSILIQLTRQFHVIL